MKSFKLFAVLATALMLSACGPQIPQMPQQPMAEVAQQAGGFDTGDAAVGALVGAGAGYMMGRAGSNNQPRTIIVDRRPVNYGYGGYGARKTVTTTTTRRGMFGKTTTRTTTRRR